MHVHQDRRARTHQLLFEDALQRNAHDPRRTFDDLYESMSAVASFGRTGRFDYLTMIGNLGLAPIEAARPYLQGATGPLRGAKLLLTGNPTASRNVRDLERFLVDLGAALKIGMQTVEDSLCNWQKSPSAFKHFGG